MNQANKKLYRFHYSIELQEDLHCGSGLGSLFVDNPLRRDHKGVPCIPASHIKGVWRDTAIRLASLQAPGFEDAYQWFGATATTRSRLHCPMLRPEPQQTVNTHVLMQSAREQNSRRPATDTLRSTEYLAAGCTLLGYGFFQGSSEEFQNLKTLVGRIDRYGGNRSRGDGRIKCLKFEEAALPSLKLESVADYNEGIRLILEAAAPVQIPQTGSPGNIIESASYIPGRMLAGAITQSLLSHDASNPEQLFNSSAHCGPAFPLPENLQETSLAVLQIMPAPLEFRRKKPEVTPCSASHYLPVWGQPLAQTDPNSHWVDLLAPQDNRYPLKRLPDHTYLLFDPANGYQCFQQPLELVMRNRRGSDPSAIPEGHMKDNLFSNEQVPAGTCFVADILPGASGWEQWLKRLHALLAERQILFIGRGSTPILVKAVFALPSEQSKESNLQADSPIKEFRLTLTSDALIRTPWLGFHQSLSLQALYDALKLNLPKNSPPASKQISEAAPDRAFNAASGLPRPTVSIIKAGSSIKIQGEDTHSLYAALCEQRALGERQQEGLGRFHLGIAAITTSPLINHPAEPPLQVLRSEKIACEVNAMLEAHKNQLNTVPSPSQLGSLRAKLDAPNMNAAVFSGIRASLKQAAKDSKGSKIWQQLAEDQGLLHTLEKKLLNDNDWSSDDLRLAWRLLASRLSLAGSANAANAASTQGEAQ